MFAAASWPVIVRPMPNALEALVGEMTLADLAKKSNRTVEQLVGFAFGNAGPARGRQAATASAPAKSAPSSQRQAGKVNTRSAAGRAAYEQAVYDVVANANGKVAAVGIRAKVGGTPMQARAALNRLIEDGKITYEGKARATKYSLA
jgi:hypothetical protein